MIEIVRHAKSRYEAIGEIVLNRPEKRNALTPAMLKDLRAAVQQLVEDDTCGAMVLRGEGGTFCSGFDLSLCRDDPGALEAMLRGLAEAITTIREAPKPVIVAVQGAAIAGGCALAVAGDLVVTHTTAKLGYPVVMLGISPAVNAPAVIRSMGSRAGRERLLDPQLISGAEAYRLGLATRCVDIPEDVIPRSQIEAATLADKPRRGMAILKHWLNTIDGSNDAAQSERALAVSLGLVGSAEEHERLTKLWS